MQDWFEKHILRHTRETQLHPLQKIAVAGLFLLLCVSLIESTLTPSQQREIDRMLASVLPGVIVDLTNSEREAKNLGTLTRNPLLDEAARLKGMHMKQNDYFAHDSPQGITPWYWFDIVKYDYLYAGENLAVYFDDSEEVVEAWMESPLHKDNLLKKEYTEIGVAVVEGMHDGYSTYFVVQLFGTPAVQKKTVPAVEKPEIQKIAEAEVPKTPNTQESAILGDAEVEKTVLKKVDTTIPEKALVPTSEEEARVLEEEAPQEETEQVGQQESTLVEKIQVDDKTVYITDHASSSTVPTIASTNGSIEEGGFGMNTKNMLRALYVFLFTVTVGFIIASILFAEKRLHHVQAMYGFFLLFITFVLLSFHAQVVTATTSIL